MVEGRRLGPGVAQQREVLRGTAVPRVMVGPVAVFGLVGVAAAGDDVHRQTAITQLVQSREFAAGDRRRNEPRPMRQEEGEPFGDGGSVCADQKTVRRLRKIPDQHAVEASPLVNACGLGNDPGVKRRAGGRDQLRGDTPIQPITSTEMRPTS